MDSRLDNKPAKDEQIKQLLRPLADLLEQPEITETTINQPCEVWVKDKQGWSYRVIPELTENYLYSLATAMIVYNELQPKSIVSVLLPGGERGQIVMPPACINGTIYLSIRKHSLIVKTLEQLKEEGVFDNFVDVSFNKPNSEEETGFYPSTIL